LLDLRSTDATQLYQVELALRQTLDQWVVHPPTSAL
jgi:hypothetical protein